MSEAKTSWIVELIDHITAPINTVNESVNKIDHNIDALSASINQLSDNLAAAFAKSDQGAQKANKSLSLLAVQAGADAIQNLAQPFLDGSEGLYQYDSALRELSSITGVIGPGLDDIGERARASAVKFGGDAAQSVNSYTILLSKLTPEIANAPVALEMMGNSVALLGETMKGNLVGAANAASSAVNQFGVDLTDPVAAAKEMDTMLNMMAAAAKVGSQDVPVVAAAIDEVGAVAKQANVSFAETNAALQVLGKYGKEGAEGGRALRNVLAVLSKQDFLPKEVQEQLLESGINVNLLSDKSKSLGERITELKKLSGNDSLLGAMFGTENTVAITGLLGNIDLLKQYTNDIKNDQTALADMAAITGQSYQEQKDRMTAYFEDIKLSVYGVTGSMLPFIDVGLTGVLGVINLAPGIMATVNMFQALSKVQWIATAATKIATAAQWLWNAALNANPIGLIIIGVTALVAAIVWAYNEFDTFRALIDGLGATFKLVFDSIYRYIMLLLAPIRLAFGFLTGGVQGFKDAQQGIKDDAVKLVDNGKNIVTGKAFKDGYNESMAESEKRHAEEDKEKSGVDSTVNKNKALDGKVTQPGGNMKPAGLSIQGSGGSKSITMHLEVKNYFTQVKSDMDVRKIANQVAGVINDRIKDTLLMAE